MLTRLSRAMAGLFIAALMTAGCAGDPAPDRPPGMDDLDFLITPRPTPAWPTAAPTPDPENAPTLEIGLPAPERRPTSTTSPTSTPKPTPTNPEEIYLSSWASCNGRYQGEDYQRRRTTAQSVLERNLHSADSLVELIRRDCDGVFASPEALAASQDGSTSLPQWPNPTFRPKPTPHPDGSWFVRGAGDVWVMRYIDHEGSTRQTLMPKGWEPEGDASIGTQPTPTRPPKPTNTPWVRVHPTSTPRAPSLSPTTTPAPSPAPTPTRHAPSWPTPGPIAGLPNHAERPEDLPNWRWLFFQEPLLAERIRQTPWAADGLNRAEAEALRWLMQLAARTDGPDDAAALLNMPFLQQVEHSDALALQTIANTSHASPGTYQRLLESNRVRAGVTNAAAAEITALGLMLRRDGDLAVGMLDRMALRVEHGSVRSADGRQVPISIYRTRPGQNGTMTDIHQSVKTAETLMRSPLPVGHLILLVHDQGVSDGSAGTNHGAAIAIQEHFEHGSPYQQQARAGTIAHEIGHYWWHNNHDWIDEGVAEMIEAVHLNLTRDRPLQPQRSPCAAYDTVRDLEAADPKIGDTGHVCNYSFGERVMLALLQEQGAERTYAGLSRLHQLSLRNGNEGIYFRHLKEEFPESKALDLWYNHGGQSSQASVSGEQTDPSLPGINGHIESVSLNTLSDSVLDAKVEATMGNAGGSETLQLRLEYEDGFTFRETEFVLKSTGSGSMWRSWKFPEADRFRSGKYSLTVWHDGRLAGHATTTVP